MSINYAILGILKNKSLTGYDLKKIMQDSNFMHWSGNNNQIYKALTELLEKGLVTNELKHQDNSPTKKIYSITNEGLIALKEWIMSPSQVVEIKKPFLVQLAFADILNIVELNKIIDDYEYQVKMQMLMEEKNVDNGSVFSQNTALGTVLLNSINSNVLGTYSLELNWIKELRNALADLPQNSITEDTIEEPISKNEINYYVKNKESVTYVYVDNTGKKISNEKDIIDLLTILMEQNVQVLVLQEDSFSSSLFDVNSGLLGTLLLKFNMYNIKSNLVLNSAQKLSPKFKKLLQEAEKSNSFKCSYSSKELENWLLKIQN